MYLDVLAELIKLLGPFLLSMENGRASGGTSNTLVDNTKTWKMDMWKGAYVHIYDGTGKGQIRKIISNTSDTLTVDEDWTEIPDDTSKYRIFISFSEDSVVFQDIKSLIESINNKTVKVDTDNVKVVSEVAYDSDNDLKKIRIDVDNAGLAKEDTLSAIKNALDSVGTDKIRASIVDALPESPFNITKIAGTALTGRDWSSDFAKLQNLDLAITALRDALLDPVLDQPILNNATIDSAGESDILNIRGAKHVDVLIYVGAPTGSPNVTFHLQVIEPTSGKVIRTYDGNQLTNEGPDYITVDGLTLGTHVKVTWDGTLDSSNYFSGCFVRVVAKR